MKPEIIICHQCDGSGEEEKRVGGYDTETVNCSLCCGSGRLVKSIVYKPYKK